MLNLMSQRGFVNPALLGVVGAVIAGCTLFIYYEGTQLKSSGDAPPQESQPTESVDTSAFPTFTGATFVKKETVKECKNLAENHPPIPICESDQYIYSVDSSTTPSQIRDWYKNSQNTKPWTCFDGYCTNENGDQFALLIKDSQIIYKVTNYDRYSYLPDWQTVFSLGAMYSYPQGWTLDDTGLKSPDYQKEGSILSAGCVINGSVPAVPDSLKSTQKITFLTDQNATFSAWQNPNDKTIYWELKTSKYKPVTLQSATKEAGDSCQDIFWKYAKSIKIIENPEAPELTLLETN